MTILDWVGSVGGIAGALMLALHASWSGWAYAVLLVFTGILLVVACMRGRWPYAALFAAFTAINVIGIYQWLISR